MADRDVSGGRVGDLVIPLDGEPGLPWTWFLLEAARGGVRVPGWVLLAIPAVVGEHLGVPAGDVTGGHLDEALAGLPDNPRPLLNRLLKAAGVPMPHPVDAELRLTAEQVSGAFRAPVALEDLLHDVAIIVQADYGPEGFIACVDATSDDDDGPWDARGAVAAMVYLLLMAS